MSMKEVREALADGMRQWQKIEAASVTSTYRVMEQTNNPLIHKVMEIIQRDSQTHYAIQGFILSTLEEQAPSLDPDELAQVWDSIEKHLKLEKQMVGFVKEALQTIQGRHMVIQEYLLNYLLEDEKKHDMLLETLDKIKSGMYPYSS